MQPASLSVQSLNVILQHLCEQQYTHPYATLLKQLKEQGLVQLFTCQVFEQFVKLYPKYVTNDIVNTLCNKRLKYLHLKNCCEVTSEGFQGALERCPNITSVDISGCDQLVTPLLGKLLSIRDVKILILKRCSLLNDFRSKEISQFCTKLQEIYLDECENITDISFFKFSETFGSNLTTISLSGCLNVTNEFVKSLTAVTKSKLRSVNLSCTGIDCMALVYLAGFVFYNIKDKSSPVVENPSQSTVTAIENDIEPSRNNKPDDKITDKCISLQISVRQKSMTSSSTAQSQPFTSDEHDSVNSFDFSSWDIISLNDVILEEETEEQCTCLTVDEPLEIDQTHASVDLSRDEINESCESSDQIDNFNDLTFEFENSLQRIFNPNITSLDVTQIAFFEAGIGNKCLQIFTNANKCLQDFSISWEALSNEDLKCVAQNETDLRSISLIDCLDINGDGIKVLGDHCHNLVNIDLKGSSFVNDSSLIHLVEKNRNIRYLGFAESSLSDQVMFKIADVLQEKLIHLDLSWCENVTDDSVVDILSKCKELRYLNLRQCEVTMVTLDAITKFGTNLTSLSLCGIKGTNVWNCQGYIQNLTALGKLTNLDLSWNTLITDDTLSILLHSCNCLHTVILVGLKCISSKPFLPIIENYKSWCRLREDVCKRLQSQLGKACRTRLKKFEQFVVIDKDFYLPFRSMHYASELRELSLNYCDKVDDDKLAEIVAVCRGTLTIDDYYGEPIKPKWNPKDLLALP